MKKFLNLLVCAGAAACLVSCGDDTKDDAKYMVDAEQQSAALASINNYTFISTATTGTVSVTIKSYLTENIFMVENEAQSQIDIYSFEDERYFHYNKYYDNDWTIYEIDKYSYSYYVSDYEFCSAVGVEISDLSKFEFNSKSNMYEYKDTLDGINYKTSFMFEDAKLVKAEQKVSGKIYGVKFSATVVFNNFGTTTIDLPNVQKPEIVTPTE